MTRSGVPRGQNHNWFPLTWWQDPAAERTCMNCGLHARNVSVEVEIRHPELGVKKGKSGAVQTRSTDDQLWETMWAISPCPQVRI